MQKYFSFVAIRNLIRNSSEEDIYYFSKNLLWVALTLLSLRVISTWVLAVVYGQSWHLFWIGGFFPVIAFESSVDVFRMINSHSMVGVAGVIFSVYLWELHRERSRWVAWYFGLWMTILQFLVALLINYYIQFSINPSIFWPMFIMLCIASGILFWKMKSSKPSA